MDISQLLSTIRAIPAPTAPPELEAALAPLPLVQISAAGRAARFERNVTVLAGATALAIGSYLALAVHGFWGTALAVGTIFTTVCSLDIKTKFKAQYDGAQTAWEEQRTIWRNQAGPEKFEKARNHYLSLANTHAKLPAKEHEMLNALEQKKREIQFISYMKSQSIDRAKISGIGQGRKVTLASYGFQTAWDVRNGRIGSVPGFGPSLVGEMEAWASSITKKFVFNASIPTDPQAVQDVKNKIGEQRAKIERELGNASDDLHRLKEATETFRNAPPQTMLDALVRLKQVEVDRG
ncbi:hypothetical protein FY133_23795 (plasmid) [Agrobacterium tumefaciens]|uniref:Uncharacterized protein n=1 Tax=Agrobacterium tumefaciens TaxID=358 RepID=A0AAP9E9H2_AGRTU|nr:hypothetical protein [Agrobacterium tumefaciens]NSZ61061.1 hypothetical protein [Agrobacterium tumefaciens]QDY97487.1 hypothetical protein CG010_025190 [Agrobacterium tumefaciens]UXS12616.1 hypothetical protein FY155_23350 [Agrobacterium tumefaciens]UXS19977.1 hypothetical protein FY154_23340 [Agrobacterium tumefaciens]UXS27625.1 hypothetical protein FY153_24185 [Agrobacterium tumefaciens]